MRHAPRQFVRCLVGEGIFPEEVGRMRRALSSVVVVVLVIALSPVADAKAPARFSVGAPGVGDPYFPLTGTVGTASTTTG